ncbi:MAG: AMP-binding protein, partial [Acidimicrobiia bacterium]
MSGLRSRSVPAPGQAPLVASNAAALLRRNASEFPDAVAIKFGDRSWTHREYFGEACRVARLLDERLPSEGPRHVAVLLDNTPEYLFALGGAGLLGAAVVGLNHTRRGEHLLRDIEHTHCGLVITEPRHEVLLAPIAEALPPVMMSTRFADDDDPAATLGESLDDALASVSSEDLGLEPDLDAIWALIFTSGTSSAPKAVVCSQRRLLVTGNRMRMIMDLGPDDVGYVCMPLFHSNAVQVGWAPSIVTPCAVSLGRRFSASAWLPDVRRYGATYFNYTGKPLAYLLAQPEQPDDADNPLRVAFGNEGSPEVVQTFGRRFDLEVIDAYGATEGGVAVNRDAEERAGALGLAPDHVKVVDDDGAEKARAVLDAHGRVE